MHEETFWAKLAKEFQPRIVVKSGSEMIDQ
jgi:hypothetical protein